MIMIAMQILKIHPTGNKKSCYFAIFFKFSKTHVQAFKKNDIRHNQGICCKCAFSVYFLHSKKEGKFKQD
jgi:hypothetical protein